MSYTAPQYVDTKEQAILALASTIKGEAVTGGDGSVNKALDILADVLAEQDVQVPQTDAGAILALAQYASGMVKPEGTIAITENGEGIDVAQYATANVSVSGGGASVGALQERIYIFDSKPSVNDEFSPLQEQLMPDAVMVGDSVVVVGNCAMLAADSWGIIAELEEESRPAAFKFSVDVGVSPTVINAIEDVTLSWESVTFDGYASSAFQMPDITGYYLGVVFPAD